VILKQQLMTSKHSTPGAYIQNEPAFPGTAIAVATAIPVFIGYTEIAERNGKSLILQPTRIISFAEYTAHFGGALNAQFSIADPATGIKQDTFMLNGASNVLKKKDKFTAYLFNAIRLFYANGGGVCYVLALNTYGSGRDGLEMSVEDFTGGPAKADPFELLKKESEPTLIVMPDAIALGTACYTNVYTKALEHCSSSQNCFAIFDLIHQGPADSMAVIVNDFRDKIGMNALSYGAAYYPWLKATVVQPSEVSFENLDAAVDLEYLLPETAAIEIVKKFKTNGTPDDVSKKNYHQDLKTASPTYNTLLEAIRSRWNELPPSAAMAGLYAIVDANHGVWKAPANISVSSVIAPTITISHDEQENLNVDLTGKSINAIRPFPGTGTLVWGARTLDGNSLDWKYINVKRTLMMIEQSLKLASRAYVFESNDATTWLTIKSMMVNFMTNLWKQGALAGDTPEVAFDVQVGLDTTMTAADILDGKLVITIKLAVVRPAEFIVITFQQQMQQA
jgi:phage tail sheath protein FI